MVRETYRISLSTEGLIFGEEVGNKGNKKAVPLIALNEENFVFIPLTDEEQNEINKIHTKLGIK